MRYNTISRHYPASGITKLCVASVELTATTLTTRVATVYGKARIFFGAPEHGPQIQLFDAAGKCICQYDLPRMTGPERERLAYVASLMAIECGGSHATR